MESDEEVGAWLRRAAEAGSPVVLLTSGGTTAPLEHSTVRYLDNFSTGGRGAASAEHFLSAGCWVCLLHRAGSQLPFQRRLQPGQLLADLQPGPGPAELTLTGLSAAQLAQPAAQYQQISRAGRLLQLPFTTVHQYLHLLRTTACQLAQLHKQLIVYLAAAVSDFYLPAESMHQHKIQSDGQPLQLILQPVPKVLGDLTSCWAPRAFTVTFKLETDPELLLTKARRALQHYRHQLVVANLLQTRRHQVTMVTPADHTVLASSGDVELEQLIVQDVLRRHAIYVQSE